MVLEKIRRSRGRRWVVARGHYSQRPGVSDRVTTTQTARALRKSRMRAKRFFFAAMDLGAERVEIFVWRRFVGDVARW